MRQGIDADLIWAANTLAKYVEENMAEGWELKLVMNSEESYLELTNPDGDDVDYQHDGNESSVRCACDESKSDPT